MATITRREAGYQAQVRHTGYPARSKCFTTLRDAEKWARQIENELDRTKLVGTTAINAGHVPALAMQPEMSKDQPRLRHSVPESRQTRTMSFTTWNHR